MRAGARSLALVAALGIGVLAGCGPRSDSAETAAHAVATVGARALEVRTFDDVVGARGQWRSSGEVLITAPFAGGVDSVGARVGDPVERGQTLCMLVTRESQAALRGAELLARQARDAASRAEAERALELARRELVRVPLVAPSSGVVVRRSAEPGAQVGESAELLALVTRDAIVFEAHVSATDAGRVKPGQPATLVEEGRDPRRATVQRVLPMASASDQTTLVWLVPGPGPTPALGRYATATITVGAPRSGVAVPDSAVVEDDLTGEKRVAVISPGGFAVWMPITLGGGANGWHQLVSPPLPAGTQVVVEGQHGLPDSTRVHLAR